MASCCICPWLQPSQAPDTCSLPGKAPVQGKQQRLCRCGQRRNACWYRLHLHREALLTQRVEEEAFATRTCLPFVPFFHDKLAPARCPPSLPTRTSLPWVACWHVGLPLPNWYTAEFVSFKLLDQLHSVWGKRGDIWPSLKPASGGLTGHYFL